MRQQKASQDEWFTAYERVYRDLPDDTHEPCPNCGHHALRLVIVSRGKGADGHAYFWCNHCRFGIHLSTVPLPKGVIPLSPDLTASQVAEHVTNYTDIRSLPGEQWIEIVAPMEPEQAVIELREWLGRFDLEPGDVPKADIREAFTIAGNSRYPATYSVRQAALDQMTAGTYQKSRGRQAVVRELVDRWRMLVEDVEVGYPDRADDYDDDLSVRSRLRDALDRLTPSEYAHALYTHHVAELDNRFTAATRQVDEDSPADDLNPWTGRIPLKPGPAMRADLEARKLGR